MAGNSPARIGVLALQGDVAEHVTMLRSLGADVVEVRLPTDLEGLEGLVLPGGESSVMDKLLRLFTLQEPLRALIRQGLPVLGTCAGLILLADTLEDGIAGQQTLGGLDVSVSRNAFGSQVDSTEVDLSIDGIDGEPMTVALIRAPLVTTVGEGVRVIARMPDGGIVGVEQGALIGVSFHPEITGDTRLHRYFLERVAQS
ncbi:MAG: pyridoxal 5'-phosphate synthase glutaminase subunit PdxT [Microbacteriaceae bacterium]|nr:pyridoxal 5'-phosphate synthase glutaminase subunit PdxT [Microbacteriaceae bacterium]MBT5731018.1 pyridoxal 5'-phosphate synthase glutaminase subunit PdxT [Microbacteriaceae bacterium]